tara:strand:- start:3311 stop:5221 length:1911 start_codon:yes stop_codon:yes gene_type:complete
MGDTPIRRGQLITPFGVGALYVSKDGEGIITAGLDHWFKKPNGALTEGIHEYKFNEHRLEKQLAVNHFRYPPDYRTPLSSFSDQDKNTYLKIPFLRFPRWHFCNYCRKLKKVSSSKPGLVVCSECTSKRRNTSNNFNVSMIQVPIVVVCDAGHIQDFPWNEWVHRSSQPQCDGNNLRLISKGRQGLLGMTVRCENCNVSDRSLVGVLTGKKNQQTSKYETILSETLDNSENDYLCNGKNIWNGEDQISDCDNHIIGSLRSSSNIYFSKIETSIYVPEELNDVLSTILDYFNELPTITLIDAKNDLGEEIDLNLFRKSSRLKKLYQNFSDEDILRAIEVYYKRNEQKDEIEEEKNEIEFRRPEYELFNKKYNFKEIITDILDINQYSDIIKNNFEKITLVKKLTETKALYGFTRLNTDTDLTRRQLKENLWREQPDPLNSWLPAIQVSGEGIFFNFKEELVQKFENNSEIKSRIEKFLNFERSIALDPLKANARYMLLHTFSHIMINTLIFECGYGAASLQERIYCSNDNSYPMASVLIYTSAGDSEGTMGGLVRMGNPKFLEKVLEKALETSMWCSVDPVCMEVSDRGGQGPGSLNLASCHNCGLVPETSCEAFNSYLDRAMLCGTIENKKMGYFN